MTNTTHMSSPLVTVILATRNRAHRVPCAIESVLAQSFGDWELCIVDDESTDGTADLLAQFAARDGRINVFRNETRRGLARSHNRAIAESRGKYIAVIDDDDSWRIGDKLARQAAFLEEHPDHVAVGGGMVVCDEDGNERYRYLKPETDDAIRRTMLYANPMAHSTVLYSKDAADRVGRYDERFDGHAADRALFMRLGRLGKLYNFPEYFTSYTLGTGNMMVKDQRKQLGASFAYARSYGDGYPNYVPALALNAAVYGYSFLPRAVRAALNEKLIYVKRKIFDVV